jgi:transcriptional regulator with XRE-family HTH domain
MPKRPKPEDPAASRRRDERAERLKLLRSVVEPVQAEAARQAGVPAYTWNRYETGRGEIGVDALAAFANAYDVTTDYVLTGDLRGLRTDVLDAVLILRARRGPTPPSPGRNEVQPGPAPSDIRPASGRHKGDKVGA